tara:strand:- start:41564 stop:42691 length:1128 start_codon:yes stop_codon:yes gene_type:complete
MITKNKIKSILDGYDEENITIGTLGGHSALDICRGAKNLGFKTVVVCQKGREQTYSKYYKSNGELGVVDDVIVVDKFKDITKKSVQKELVKKNTIFLQSRYFWVYCDYKEVENDFEVPIFGTRDMVKLEERDIDKNQYYLLEKAGIRIPKMFNNPQDIDRLVIVKVAEAARGYERAFFLCSSFEQYTEKSGELLEKGIIKKGDLDKAVIEEYAVGAHVNFNFFYSPITGELELMGTDMRRQTNLDGVLRLPAPEQVEALKHMKIKMVETGHVAVTIKESLLEKVFKMGEKFVETCKKEHPVGLIGPFALQGAVVADEGKEDIVIFDVSLRIPGSPGTMFTPYSAYLYRNPISYGERVAMEVKDAIKSGKLDKILT